MVVGDGKGRFAEHVGNDSIKGYIADRESILETILFARFTGNQFKPVARIFAQNLNRLFGDETGDCPNSRGN